MGKQYDSHCGIAHTRWATHGAPCTINAHPHVSSTPDSEFVVVHNGIITNYQARTGHPPLPFPPPPPSSFRLAPCYL